MSIKVLSLRDKGVRDVIANHPALQGLTRIGRGTFSAVYDNGDTVIKLTSDAHHYELLTQGYACTDHFPKLVNDWGDVGVQEFGDADLYLIEVEKLSKVGASTDAAKMARKLCALAAKTMKIKSPIFERNAKSIDMSLIVPETFFTMARDEKLPDSIRASLEQLASFCMDYDGVAMDFHLANFMVRPGTDTLIFSDPVYDINRLNARYKMGMAA